MKNSVTFREKIGYGFGDMASSMFWKIFGMYLLFFYTKVFGITPAAAGTMFLVTRIWDSLNDPIMGLLADRTRSRWGRYRPYLLWGAFPFAAVGVLTFWTPDFGMTGKLAWAYITYTAMMMVYTMVNVPHASLLGVMTPDTKIRNTFSSYRMFFAYVGSLVTFMLLQPLVDFFAGRLGGGDTDRLSGSVAGWPYRGCRRRGLAPWPLSERFAPCFSGSASAGRANGFGSTTRSWRRDRSAAT